MEILKPNSEDCEGCEFFISKGSVIADRFLVQVDTCVLKNAGQKCKNDANTDIIKPEDNKQS